MDIDDEGGRRKRDDRRVSSDSDLSFYSARSSLTPVRGYGVVEATPYVETNTPFRETDRITHDHPNPSATHSSDAQSSGIEHVVSHPKSKTKSSPMNVKYGGLKIERHLSILSTQAHDGDVEDADDMGAASVSSSSGSDSRDVHLDELEEGRSARSTDKLSRAKAALRQARSFFHRAFCFESVHKADEALRELAGMTCDIASGLRKRAGKLRNKAMADTTSFENVIQQIRDATNSERLSRGSGKSSARGGWQTVKSEPELLVTMRLEKEEKCCSRKF